MITISYSSELKKSLLEISTKKNCCRRSEFFGVLSSRSFLTSNGIYVHSEKEELTEYIKKSVRENFNREVQILPSSSGRGKDLFFRNENASKYIASIQNGEILPTEICKCPVCANSFLRGVFIACGRVTDPAKSFHLEFSLGERCDAFVPVFSSFGFQSKITKRRNEKLIYFKSSNVLEDFFTIIGDSSVTIDIINNTIEGQFKSEANRRANFETSNISRAVSTGFAQADIIQKLIDSDRLILLPNDLKQTALLRLENPDVSITQLAALSNPPISKSGINHRIQKILEFAKSVTSEK